MPAQPTIATPRLTLVPALLADLDELWTIWRDRDVRRYLFDDQDVTRETATDVLNGCLEQGPAGLGLWTIRLGGMTVGCIGFMPIGVAAEHEPTLRGLVEPIVVLAPAHWGNGYADEALVASLDYVFATLGFASVAGVNDVPNEASHRMLLRAGFVPIGECPGPHYRLRTYRLNRDAFTRGSAR